MDNEITRIFSILYGLIDIDVGLFEDGIIKFHPPTKILGDENRFAVPPNFRVPGLCPDRPMSADNRVAFHLGHSVVVKHANYQASGRKVEDHAVVVKPNGQTASANAAKFEHYISRDDAVLVVELENSENARALFTNIHPDVERRSEFWNAVAKIGKPPRRDVVTLYPQRLSNEKWSEIAENYDGPPELIWGILHAQASLFTRLLPVPEGKHGAVAVYMPRDQFNRFKRYLRRKGDWDPQYPAAEIKLGRRRRIQRRLVAELPTGLTEVAMYRVAQKFAQHLAEKQVMYTVVVHAPDSHNDERNFHIHAVIYDRPSEFLEEHGCWDFEYAVPVKRYRYPFKYPLRKNKIDWLNRSSTGNNYRQYAVEAIRKLRETFADICNEELINCGCNRLFDHRSYEAMGIRQKPIKRLTQRDTLLSAAGVPTAKDAENAEQSWQGAFDRALEHHLLQQERRGAFRDRIVKTIAAARDSGLNSESLQKAECNLERLDTLIDQLAPREWPITKLYLTYLMANSRADKTSEMCQRLIDGIDAGVAKASDLRWEDEIRDRYKAAFDHSDHVDRTVFPAIKAIDTRAQLDELDRLESALEALLETVRNETKVRNSLATLQTTGCAPENVAGEVEPMPNVVPGIGAQASMSTDREDAWERLIQRIESEELDLDPQSPFEVCRIPALSDEEHALLRDAEFAERSQKRLEALRHRQEVRPKGEMPNVPQPLDAIPASSHIINPELNSQEPDADRANSKPAVPCPYNEALERRRSEHELMRQEAAQIWFKDFEKHFLGKPLPISFKEDDPIVDVARLPRHLVGIAESLADHVNRLIEPFVKDMRELARGAIFGAREPLIRFRNGRAEYNPMDFCSLIQLDRNWLLDLDPVVHRFAMEALQRSRNETRTPALHREEPIEVAERAIDPRVEEKIPPEQSDAVEVETQAEFLAMKRQRSR